MKIVYNNLIPFKGFAAINIFGVLFVRKGVKVTEKMINHEMIHTAQMKEMFYIFFYLWYFVEWLIRLPFGNAYRSISFEVEAYMFDDCEEYLMNRESLKWIDYL